MQNITTKAIGAVSRSTTTGKPAATQKLNLVISVNMSDLKGMESYARQVVDPSSPNYHRFLTPTQVGNTFGATTSTVNSIVSYLKGKGMTITLATKSRTTILATATVKQAETAFGTTLFNYQTKIVNEPVGRHQFYANSTPIKLPSSIASKVARVGGLDDFYRVKPRSTFLTPDQTRTLYDVNNLYSTLGNQGSGITIGIFNQDGFQLSNVPIFYSTFGLPVPSGGLGSNITVEEFDGGGNANTDGVGEGDLDIQLSLAMAPLANLIVYDSPNSVAAATALDAAIADENKVDIVSESYGVPVGSETLGDVAAQHASIVQAATEGITYLCASGDDGTYSVPTDDNYPDAFPDIDPYVTCVGGSVATIAADGTRVREDGWVGSGGGWLPYNPTALGFNTLPSYQSAIGIGIPYRTFPDVALHAAGSNDPNSDDYYDAYSFVYGGIVQGVSGTSAASPTFAGQIAIMLEQARTDGTVSSSMDRFGLFNPQLYTAYADSSSGAFYDILTGDNGILPSGGESLGGVGYDFVTGLGAPIIDNLYDYISGTSRDRRGNEHGAFHHDFRASYYAHQRDWGQRIFPLYGGRRVDVESSVGGSARRRRGCRDDGLRDPSVGREAPRGQRPGRSEHP